MVVAGVRQHPAVSQLGLAVMNPQARAMPPAAVLWEKYAINPLTGEIHSRRRPGLGPLGHFNGRYWQINHNTAEQHMRIQNHRLVWKWMTGRDPEHTIDHKDRDRSNNRIWNLRDVDHTVQNRNSSNCKLSQDDIERIRALRATGLSQSVIAKQFGVDQSRICQLTKPVQSST